MTSRNRNRAFPALVLSVALLGACTAMKPAEPAAPTPPPAPTLPTQDKIVSFFRSRVNLPPNIPAAITGIQASTVFPGLTEATLQVGEGQNTRSVPLVTSPDGRWVMFGAPVDVNVDLAKEAADREKAAGDQAKQIASKIDLTGEPFRGPADAKVTIVEYSDFQCPFCSKGYQTLENDVLKNYGDKVKFYYKHYPLPFHPWAEPAAVAAECAKMQKPDAFWALYHGFFEHQADTNPENVKAKATEYAKKAGLNMKDWNECVDQKKSLPKVKAQAAEGQAIGVNGTPAFFINGHNLEGAQPFEQFKAIIDAELTPAS